MPYQIGQTFTATTTAKTLNGKSFIETAKIIHLTANRIVYQWSVDGELISELSCGPKRFARKFETT